MASKQSYEQHRDSSLPCGPKAFPSTAQGEPGRRDNTGRPRSSGVSDGVHSQLLDLAISERLQELVELLLGDATNHLFQASAEILAILKHKLEADAVV
ncbi:MAG: hypothetical protein ABR912_10105, partial [Terracidiphilus sp.]